nr:GNAT family N-acetyltransferase [Nocardioides sp. zg-1230]
MLVDGCRGHHGRVLDTGGVVVVRDRDPSSQWAAARIWAVATAERDNKPEPAPVEAALPIIERGLRPDDATLHLAYLRDEPVGFAVVVVQPGGLEIVFLGVDPDAWGRGIASRLLSDVTDYAAETSRPEVELWVYDDNARAVELYRRAGWSATDDVRIHPTSGRLERRHVRSVLGTTRGVVPQQ